jgi:hypothetical protein
MSIVHSDLYVDKFPLVDDLPHGYITIEDMMFFFCSQTIDHLQQDLAKCGVKCKSRKIKYPYFGYLLELVVEILQIFPQIWRIRTCFQTKILCMC